MGLKPHQFATAMSYRYRSLQPMKRIIPVMPSAFFVFSEFLKLTAYAIFNDISFPWKFKY